MHRLLPTLLIIALCGFAGWVRAANPAVYQDSVNRPVDAVITALRKELDAAGFFVADEMHMHRSLAQMAERWGADYNRNGFEAIVTLIICNGWYVNQLSNLDPELLGLCPLHLTLLHKRGETRVLFNRPTALAADSPARSVIEEVELEVSKAIGRALRGN